MVHVSISRIVFFPRLILFMHCVTVLWPILSPAVRPPPHPCGCQISLLDMSSYICRQEEDDSPLRSGSSSSSQKEDGIDSGSLNDDSPPRGHDSGLKESLLDSDSLDAAREDYLIDPPLSASLAAAEGDVEIAEDAPDDALMPFSSMDVDGGDWEDEDDLFGK